MVANTPNRTDTGILKGALEKHDSNKIVVFERVLAHSRNGRRLCLALIAICYHAKKVPIERATSVNKGGMFPPCFFQCARSTLKIFFKGEVNRKKITDSLADRLNGGSNGNATVKNF